MLVLAVDTSSPVVSVAVAEVDAAGRAGPDAVVRVLAERSVAAPNRHGEVLAGEVHHALRVAGAAPAELAATVAGLGPGPFTGLRVGIVTVAALADALGVPAYGACSLDAVALAAAADGLTGRVLVCTDARRRQVYWARYADGVRIDGPDIAAPAQLAERFAGAVDAVVGAGAGVHADALSSLPVVDADAVPAAADVLRLVAVRVAARAGADRLEPLYLRRPDARPPGPRKAVIPA